jgi:putative membrane protein
MISRVLQLGLMFLVPLNAIAQEGVSAAGLTGTRAEVNWSFEPEVVIPLIVMAVLFAGGAYRRRHKAGYSWPQFTCFIAGWLTLVIALVSPIHRLGSLLFSVHMTQHELLMVVAAPLLVLSRPIVWFVWALPLKWRERSGRIARLPSLAALWSGMTVPVFVWLLHGSTLWAWHIPALYESSVQHDWVHGLQHTTFLFTAILFWWTLIHGRHGRLSYGSGVLYVFTTAVHTSILGALMTFAQELWYPIYAGRTAAFHITPIEDQQLGGLIMWIPASTVFILLGLWLMMAWIREAQKRVAYSAVNEGSPGA